MLKKTLLVFAGVLYAISLFLPGIVMEPTLKDNPKYQLCRDIIERGAQCILGETGHDCHFPQPGEGVVEQQRRQSLLPGTPMSEAETQAYCGDDWNTAVSKKFYGFWILLLGWLATFEGNFAWWGNPLFFATLFFIFSKQLRKAQISSVLALLCGLMAFLVIDEKIARSASGMGNFVVDYLGPGYYMWLGAIVLIIIVAFLSRRDNVTKFDTDDKLSADSVSAMDPATIMARAQRRKKLIWISASIFLLTVALNWVAYSYDQYNRDNKIKEEKKQDTFDSRPIVDPVQYFSDKFSTRDYKVVVTLHSTEADGKTADVMIPHGTYFYQKGTLVRIDSVPDNFGGTSTIIKDGKLYIVSHGEKEFFELNTNDTKAVGLLAALKTGSPIEGLLQGESSGAQPWDSIGSNATGDLGFRSEERKQSVLQMTIVLDYQIFLNPTSGLISTVVTKTKAQGTTVVTRTMSLEYEELADIESMKRFPWDFKKVDKPRFAQ